MNITRTLITITIMITITIVTILLLFSDMVRESSPKVERCWWCGSQTQLSTQRVFTSWANDKTFISPCCSMCRDTLLMGPNAKYIVYDDTLFTMVQMDTVPGKHIIDELFVRPIFVEIPLYYTPLSGLQKRYYEKIWGF